MSKQLAISSCISTLAMALMVMLMTDSHTPDRAHAAGASAQASSAPFEAESAPPSASPKKTPHSASIVPLR